MIRDIWIFFRPILSSDVRLGYELLFPHLKKTKTLKLNFLHKQLQYTESLVFNGVFVFREVEKALCLSFYISSAA